MAHIPPIVPFQASQVIDPPELIVRDKYLGTLTTITFPAAV